MAYAIKAEVCDPQAVQFTCVGMKTMYGGKHIARGDTLFIFASEKQGGSGLIGKGIVATAKPVPKEQIGGRETPRVDVAVAQLVHAKTQLGGKQLKSFTAWKDGQPATELKHPAGHVWDRDGDLFRYKVADGLLRLFCVRSGRAAMGILSVGKQAVTTRSGENGNGIYADSLRHPHNALNRRLGHYGSCAKAGRQAIA